MPLKWAAKLKTDRSRYLCKVRSPSVCDSCSLDSRHLEYTGRGYKDPPTCSITTITTGPYHYDDYGYNFLSFWRQG